MKPPCFSLRGLLILTACLAVFCYWRDRPRQIANRFVAAIEAGDYKLAENLLADDGLLTERAGKPVVWKVASNGPSFKNWLDGKYPLRLSAVCNTRLLTVSAVATATGVRRDTKYAMLSQPNKK